jgi:hypothetical protein
VLNRIVRGVSTRDYENVIVLASKGSGPVTGFKLKANRTVLRQNRLSGPDPSMTASGCSQKQPEVAEAFGLALPSFETVQAAT